MSTSANQESSADGSGVGSVPESAPNPGSVELNNLRSVARGDGRDLNDVTIPSSTLAMGSNSNNQPSQGASADPTHPDGGDSPSKNAGGSTAATSSQTADPISSSQPQDANAPATEPKAPGPSISITLLLVNGARHPYRVDSKYLKKRNIQVAEDDPFNLTVYMLKELIWREWREEWESRPTSPGAIRLIHFGRLLDDKLPLREARFNAEGPNVVHMTVKPQDLGDEEDGAKAKSGSGRDRDGSRRTPSCRCVIL